MGLDFIRQIAKPFRKSLDRRLIELNTPHLFTKNSKSGSRAYAASIFGDNKLTSGDELGIRLLNNRIFAYKGLETIAEIYSPTTELLSALRKSHGEAFGIVKEVYASARTAEIRIC